MSEGEDNKLLLRRFIEEVVNTSALERVEEFLAPDYIDHNDRSGTVTGVEGARRHLLAVCTTYPDFHLAVHEQIAEGDLVVTRITAKGTHHGEWLGLKPTNKCITIEGVNIDRVRNSRIVEHWGVANTLEALMEIGALRFPGEGKNTT